MTIKDDNFNGLIKFFHWSMALLFIWQFMAIFAVKIVGETPTTDWLWGTHKPVGFVLMLMLLGRVAWGLLTLKKRPVPTSYWSRLGHMVLYVFMALVPALALIRQYGSGRSFEFAGFTVFEGFEEEKIEWMTMLGGMLHGELGFILAALIVGHIAAGFIHRKQTRSNAIFRKII